MVWLPTFFLQKDPIFARLNLDDEEFKLISANISTPPTQSSCS